MPTSYESSSSGPLSPCSQPEHSRLLLLPKINYLLTNCADIQEAIPHISRAIAGILPHHWCGICVVEERASVCRLHAQHSPQGKLLPSELRQPLDGSPAGKAVVSGEAVIVRDLAQIDLQPEISSLLLASGWRSGCWLPLQAAGRVLGTLCLASSAAQAFNAGDPDLLADTCNAIALALAQQLTSQELKERARRELLEAESSLNQKTQQPVAILCGDMEGRILEANESFLKLVGFTREEMKAGNLRRETITPPEYMPLSGEILRQVKERGFSSPVEKEYIRSDGKRVPIIVTASQSSHNPEHMIAWVLDLSERKRLELEDLANYPEHSSEDDPVVVSLSMRKIHSQIERSAPTEATVLILGETGTGKELLAQRIHQLSQRKNQPFIKVNCAAIPSGLLESELFGHEKGAFTGALARKIGRIELAHQGTLFLDEIGDIPLELQPKLLRILQEREFERLGGTQTIRVDVRVIAATNRDLKQMAAESLFRLDLFYRLNVFPIHVPALRERREAIPQLVQHFLRKFNQQFRRNIISIPANVMAALQRHSWPGNIRELENVIERAVILSSNSELRITHQDIEAADQKTPAVRSLKEVEREHIIRALREAHGKIGGNKGAAALLGLKRTTLQYKMKKLGVARQRDF